MLVVTAPEASLGTIYVPAVESEVYGEQESFLSESSLEHSTAAEGSTKEARKAYRAAVRQRRASRRASRLLEPSDPSLQSDNASLLRDQESMLSESSTDHMAAPSPDGSKEERKAYRAAVRERRASRRASRLLEATAPPAAAVLDTNATRADPHPESEQGSLSTLGPLSTKLPLESVQEEAVSVDLPPPDAAGDDAAADPSGGNSLDGDEDGEGAFAPGKLSGALSLSVSPLMFDLTFVFGC